MFWLRFAFRSCIRRRRKTVVTLLGISFGVAALIVLGAIMVGVNDTMVENAVSLWAGDLIIEQGPMDAAHAVASAREWTTLRTDPAVQHVLPRCTFSGLLSDPEQTVPIEVWAVDPDAERAVSPVARSIISGDYLDETDDGILLGAEAASTLGLDVGDTIALSTAEHAYKVPVRGVFKTGVEGLDRSVGYMTLAAVAELDEPRVTVNAALLCSPGADLEQMRHRVEACDAEPAARIMLWNEKLPEVAQLVDLNSFSMRLVILLVVAILGFGVANALLISVMDRYRYYAVLKAIGVRPVQVVITVLAEAVIMCLAAGILGTLAGAAISHLLAHSGIDIGQYTSHNPHFSVNSIIHPRLTPVMTLAPQAMALVAATVAALWPALMAAKRSVSTGMRDL